MMSDYKYWTLEQLEKEATRLNVAWRRMEGVIADRKSIPVRQRFTREFGYDVGEHGTHVMVVDSDNKYEPDGTIKRISAVSYSNERWYISLSPLDSDSVSAGYHMDKIKKMRRAYVDSRVGTFMNSQ